MKTINPYLIFNGNAIEAFNFYKSVFGGDPEIVFFKDMPGTENMSEEDKNKAAHISLPIAGKNQILMASDATTGHEADIAGNSNYYLTLEPESAEEADKIYQVLTEGGNVIMPLEKTEWAEKFAMFSDKFGVQWMINYGEA